MRRALELAQQGWGRVHPNPMVGAVLLADGAAVGEGFHAEFGGPHAEAVALAAAGAACQGATLVVTLEPCAHRGKQPPCVEALIAAGISKVVAATADPNPLAGGGAERLRAAGIEYSAGLLERESRQLNAAFFHRFVNPERPYVALKLATSHDRHIADASGQVQWISGEAAQDYVHWLRAGFDAIAVGGRTAMLDDPQLTARGALHPRVTPRRVIFQGREPIPAHLTVVRSAREIPTVVVTPSQDAVQTEARLGLHGVIVISAESLAEGLAKLRGAGVESLLVEGGGRLAGALLRHELVDRFYWIQSPLRLGADGVPAAPDWDLDQLEQWSVVEQRTLERDTLRVLDRVACSPVS